MQANTISFNGAIKTYSSKQFIKEVSNKLPNTLLADIEVNTSPRKITYVVSGEQREKLMNFLKSFYNTASSPDTIVKKLEALLNKPQLLNLQFRANVDYAVKKLS